MADLIRIDSVKEQRVQERAKMVEGIEELLESQDW